MNTGMWNTYGYILTIVTEDYEAGDTRIDDIGSTVVETINEAKNRVREFAGILTDDRVEIEAIEARLVNPGAPFDSVFISHGDNDGTVMHWAIKKLA